VGIGKPPRDQQLRALIAQTAAKFMVEHGIRDFHAAKMKVAEQLGVANHSHNMPGNPEIAAAIVAYQRLFRAKTQPLALHHLRSVAVQAMKLLESFDPKLVGPVLSGHADQFSEVNLHVFSETSEAVAVFLLNRRIPYRIDECRLKVNAHRPMIFPVYHLSLDQTPIEVIVFDQGESRQAPLSSVDGRPMARASLRQVEKLLADAIDSI